MKDLAERVGRIESLISEIETSADAATTENVRELVDVLLDVHGAALEHLLDATFASGGQPAVDAAARDELVGSLLLLHGLHPQSQAVRVQQALEGVRPYLKSHGGNVELLEVTEEGIVRLSLHGSCDGCPSSAATLKSTIEAAVHGAAPDILRIEVVEREENSKSPELGEKGDGEMSDFIPMSKVMWDDCPFPAADVGIT